MTPIQTLWTAEGRDAGPFSPATLTARSRALRRKTWRRDAIEYVAALVVVAMFARYAIAATHPVARAGCVLVILGTVAVVTHLWRRRERTEPAQATASLPYLRAQLVRQRDLLASVPRWYLGPLVPGLLVFNLGIWLQRSGGALDHRATVAALIVLAIAAAVFAGVWWLNRAGARALDEQIAALDAAANPD